MRKALIVSFVALATTAFAASNTFKVSLFNDAVIDGKTFKAGEYKISLQDGKAILKQGKDSVEVPAREETVPDKIDSTSLKYSDNTHLVEISVGGTHTKIVFGDNTPTHSGM